MRIETLETAGIPAALHAMRNPMDSWERSDSGYIESPGEDSGYIYLVGPADHTLSEKLQKNGPEHCKHLRMVMVWADVIAPRYWWNEFDTYRAGVEKVSCSTMHKLMARPLTSEDFETNGLFSMYLTYAISYINEQMQKYRDAADQDTKKYIWREIIRCLPQSYRQRRTIMCSYAALRNIYRQREGHKLSEWAMFRQWVESLPESWMITE